MKNRISILFLIAAFSTNFSQILAQGDPLLNNIIKIVSPVEISDVIKTAGIQYNREILNNPQNIYQTEFKQALNLGVYSTDLGYANINEQSKDALMYLTSVKKTADKLNLGDFIDVNKILGLAANKNNLNKLLEETSVTFENMSTYLQEQQKSNLAALIMVGGWLEILHITCQVAQQQPDNKEITSRIVEQKLILGQLLQVLENYQSDPNVANLTKDLSNLNTLFDKYNFDTNSSITTKEETIGGVEILVAEDTNISADIKLSLEELLKISKVVHDIRSVIIR
ncbi:MAG: hypothetical protein NW226_26395 [Microscillaceae bacterium]|nr:hypothetical protein [Microscillaceae bacterium]